MTDKRLLNWWLVVSAPFRKLFGVIMSVLHIFRARTLIRIKICFGFCDLLGQFRGFKNMLQNANGTLTSKLLCGDPTNSQPKTLTTNRLLAIIYRGNPPYYIIFGVVYTSCLYKREMKRARKVQSTTSVQIASYKLSCHEPKWQPRLVSTRRAAGCISLLLSFVLLYWRTIYYSWASCCIYIRYPWLQKQLCIAYFVMQ